MSDDTTTDNAELETKPAPKAKKPKVRQSLHAAAVEAMRK